MSDQLTTRAPGSGPAAGGRVLPRPEAVAAPRWSRICCLLLVLCGLPLLVLVAYWGVWHFDFIYFDDPGYIKENLNVTQGLPLLKNPAVFRKAVYWAFTGFWQSNWHPLTWLSHMLDVQIYGINGPADLKPGDGLGSGGHHLTNIILHSCNVLMLFWLLFRLTGLTWPSAVVAGLFAVHPMHTESVAWVAERKDVLSTFFGFATLLAYTAYARRAKLRADILALAGLLSLCTAAYVLICFDAVHRGVLPEVQAAITQSEHYYWITWVYPLIFLATLIYALAAGRYELLFYCAVFLLYALGLLAKPMLVTLPFVFFLFDFWPLDRLQFTMPEPVMLAVASPASGYAVDRTALARRRAKRNQRLPVARRAPVELSGVESLFRQWLLPIVEKAPFLLLAAISVVLTPFAQSNGGSMASSNDLSIVFRLTNSLQSYLRYITRLFYPGRMTTLYLLDAEHIDWRFTAAAVMVLLLITAAVIVGLIYRRRYLAFGWLWYLGTLVPVIGIVQVGEQTHADRYTYIPYVGLFIMLVWGIADLIEHLPQYRRGLQFAAGAAAVAVFSVCVAWTKYQLNFWTGPEAHMRHALTIEPDSWNMLNNLGVFLWKEGQKQDALALRADAEGNADEAKQHQQKSKAFKKDAVAQWEHGISKRPTATDIWSNLGFYYSEIGEHKKAEDCLIKAVQLKEISPRPHNNLGRVLLRWSQDREIEAQKKRQEAAEAEKKGESEKAAEATKEAKSLEEESIRQRDKAIAQFERAIYYDPTLLEAHLNLGQVFLGLGIRAKNEKREAEAEECFRKSDTHYRAVLACLSEFTHDPDLLNNFSQAAIGLAQIAAQRNKIDDIVNALTLALQIKPDNTAARQMLSLARCKQGKFREAMQQQTPLLEGLPLLVRRAWVDGPGPPTAPPPMAMWKQLEAEGRHGEAIRAMEIMAWILATSPEPLLRDHAKAMEFAKRLLGVTREQDPSILDTAAAVWAANGDFAGAMQLAQRGATLAEARGNKALAEVISRRARDFYARQMPYVSAPDGSDRVWEK